MLPPHIRTDRHRSVADSDESSPAACGIRSGGRRAVAVRVFPARAMELAAAAECLRTSVRIEAANLKIPSGWRRGTHGPSGVLCRS